MNDELIGLAEAARIAGRHPSRLTEAARKGILRATKVGPRAWVVTRDDLAAWMAYLSQRAWTLNPRQRGGRPASRARTRGRA